MKNCENAMWMYCKQIIEIFHENFSFNIILQISSKEKKKKIENGDVWCITKNITYIEQTNRHHKKNFMVPSGKHCGTIDGKTKEFRNSFNKQIVMCHKKFIIVFSSEIIFLLHKNTFSSFVYVCIYADFVRRLFLKKKTENE